MEKGGISFSGLLFIILLLSRPRSSVYVSLYLSAASLPDMES